MFYCDVCDNAFTHPTALYNHECYVDHVDGWRGQRHYTKPKVNQEVKPVSTAMWCDKGNHAYSANDLDAHHYSQSMRVAGTRDQLGNGYDYRNVTQELDICGPCFMADNPFQPNANTSTTKAEILPPTEPTEEYLKGYHDGFEKGEGS